MSRIHPFALGCLACGLAVASHGEIVYDNLVTPLGNYLGGFAYEEVADDITLGGNPLARLLETVAVSYAGFNFDGDETLTVSLYRMDGPPTPGSFGFNTPGSTLYSTGPHPIGATPGTTLQAIGLGGAGVLLPDVLAVGFAFDGIDFDPTGAGSDGGPLLYDPPAVGSSLDDYWLRGFPNPGDPWGLYTFGGNPPINLGIAIVASVVPETSTWLSMVGLATLIGAIVFKRARRSR